MFFTLQLQWNRHHRSDYDSLGRGALNLLSVFWKSKRKATFHSPGWVWLSAAPPCWHQLVVHLGLWVFHLANTTRVPHCPLPPLLGRWTPHLLQRLQAAWAAAAAPPPLWPIHGCAYERWKAGKRDGVEVQAEVIYQLCPVLPDRSFRHLPILHPPCWGCEGESCGGGREGRGGCGGGRHRHHSGWGWGCWAEGWNGDLLGLGGVFPTVGTEQHAAFVGSAATAAQHGDAAAVEAVSDALVRAALQEGALQGEKQQGGADGGVLRLEWRFPCLNDRMREGVSLTARQKKPQPGQQWCWTICERWTSQRTMRGTRLEGRMVSPLIVRLVQALS